MFSKAEKNYYIDVALAITSIVCIITGFMLIREGLFRDLTFYIDRIHTISGVVMTVIAVIHVIMHTKWIKALTKNILQHRGKFLALIITILLSIGIYLVIIKMVPDRDRHEISPAGEITPDDSGEKFEERDRRFSGRDED